MSFVSARFFPSLKMGHSRKLDARTNRLGCIRCGEFDVKTCSQNPEKVRDKWKETLGTERFSPLKKAKDEGFVGGETHLGRRGSAVILPFVRNERVRIEIPALNLKFGAKKEYPQGYAGSLVGRDNHGRLFLVKLEKAWKKSREETIKEIWTPAALLARASART